MSITEGSWQPMSLAEQRHMQISIGNRFFSEEKEELLYELLAPAFENGDISHAVEGVVGDARMNPGGEVSPKELQELNEFLLLGLAVNRSQQNGEEITAQQINAMINVSSDAQDAANEFLRAQGIDLDHSAKIKPIEGSKMKAIDTLKMELALQAQKFIKSPFQHEGATEEQKEQAVEKMTDLIMEHTTLYDDREKAEFAVAGMGGLTQKAMAKQQRYDALSQAMGYTQTPQAYRGVG